MTLPVTPAPAAAPAPAQHSALPHERLLLATFVIVWLATLANRSLIGPDEGRYATLSLEMLRSGDWITPHLNGLLYFEKPPLQYWGGALAMALLGANEFAARLWPGLAGLAMVGLSGFTAGRLWGPLAGRHALLIAGAMTWIVLNSHFLSLDAGLGAALTLVLCAVLLAEHAGDAQPARRRRWMLAAWAGMGLAVLSKGLVGILIPGAVLVLLSLWRLDFRLWRHLEWWRGPALLLLITAPWFLLVSARNPDFAWFFFVHEHWQRYLTPVHRREGAWWYFVPILLAGALPWTSALPWALRARRADFATCLLVVWSVFVFAFFSASSSKLPSYILPMFPALAMLMARLSAGADARVLRRHLLLPTLLWAALLAAVPFAAGHLGGPDTPAAANHALLRGIAGGAVLFLVGVAGAWWLLGRQRLTAALAVVAATHLGATLILLGSHDTYGQQKSSDRLVPLLLPAIDASTPVFSVRTHDQTLPFYLGRPVILVDYVDEFEFGETHEPERWIPTLEAFAERWQREPRAAAYMGPDTLRGLRQRGLVFRVIYEDAQRVLVVKP